MVLEKTLESHLDCKEIQPVHSKGDQSWVFIGRTDAEAETPIFWPPHAKSWLIGKDSDAGRDWGPEEKGTTEDEMAGWHHQLDGHEFEWTPGVGDGQRGLTCCNSWGSKELDTTEQLNWSELNWLCYHQCQSNYTNPTNNCIKHLSFGQEKKKKDYITLKNICNAISLAFHRNCSRHDTCDKPRNGHVLGNFSLECHGDHGNSISIFKWPLSTYFYLSDIMYKL